MDKSRITNTLRDIGHAAFLWNRIQECWFLIFTGLLKNESRPVVEAIFKQFDSDRAQRELVVAVANASLEKNDAHRLKIVHLIAKTNDESGHRNSIMHAQFHIVTTNPTSADYDLRVGRNSASKRKNKLEFKQLKVELPAFLERLKALDQEVEYLRNDMSENPNQIQTGSLSEMLANILRQEGAD